jgi:hypothetical protein
LAKNWFRTLASEQVTGQSEQLLAAWPRGGSVPEPRTKFHSCLISAELALLSDLDLTAKILLPIFSAKAFA